jgi:hypothetical protein
MVPLRLKLLVIGVLVLALVGGIVAYGHQQYRRGHDAAEQAMQAELQREREQRQKVDWEIRRHYEDRIAELSARAGIERRGPAIRCVLDEPGEMRAGSDSAGAAGGAAGESTLRTAQDLRPELVRIGEACERLRQQVIGIKDRQEKLEASDRR